MYALGFFLFYLSRVKMLLDKLRAAGRPGRILLAIAAPVEIKAILFALNSQATVPGIWETVEACEGVDLIHVGVSKANAAGGVTQQLMTQRGAYGLVMSLGIAGALPHENGKASGYRSQVGETVVASHCDFGDEGILTEEGYKDLSEIGFPLDRRYGAVFPSDPLALGLITPLCTRVGHITAVSTCSATDDLARTIAQRTPALCEAMEGAAIALACSRFMVPMIEVRSISNLTGSRTHQNWDIKAALTSLQTVVCGLCG